MNSPKQFADFSNRRRQLGASRETMAAGLGVQLDTVKAIEDGVACDREQHWYDIWLGRIEGWPMNIRARQFHVAGQGHRFDIEDQE